MSETTNITAQDAVRDAIYTATLALDEQRWNDWLALCDESFHYSIEAFSPEIRRNMIYLDGSREEMANMVEMLPKHNTDESPLSRHTVVYKVEVDEEAGTATAVSSFAIYQTIYDGLDSHVEAGSSRLFLIGKYRDRFRLSDEGARFTARRVCLDNRRLDKGSHWPL